MNTTASTKPFLFRWLDLLIASVIDAAVALVEPFKDFKLFETSSPFFSLLFLVSVETLGAALSLPALNSLYTHMRGTGSNAKAFHFLVYVMAFGRPILAFALVPITAWFAMVIAATLGQFIDYSIAFKMAVASQAPTALSGLIAGFVLNFRGASVLKPSDLFVPTGLDAIIPMHASPLLLAAASLFSVYLIWSIAIFVTVGKRSGIQTSTALLMSAPLWAPQVLFFLTRP